MYGPNGFFRGVKGGTDAASARLDVRANYIGSLNTVTLSITNPTSEAATVRMVDRYTGKDVKTRVGPGRSFLWFWSAFKRFGWYHLSLTVAEDPALEYRLAGHIENGRDSSSDPGMGGLVPS